MTNEAGMLAHIDDLEDTNKLLLEALRHIQMDILKRPDIWAVSITSEEMLRAAIAKAEGK